MLDFRPYIPLNLTDFQNLSSLQVELV